MATYHKWIVKNDFVYVLQFLSLISDGLGGVNSIHNWSGWDDFLQSMSEDDCVSTFTKMCIGVYHAVSKTFSNFSCMIPIPNYYFQIEL